jgi:GT2 family glycosyltransferase
MNQHALMPRSLDLLSRNFKPVGGVERTPDGFSLTTPWAIARFGLFRMPRGWWSVESEGDDSELEVRVYDDAGLIFACRPAQGGGAKFYVADAVLAEIEIVPSPWPGDIRIRRLCFRRLTWMEVGHFLYLRIIQALSTDRPLAYLAAAARQLFSRSSFGARAPTLAVNKRKQTKCVTDVRAENACATLVRCHEFSYVAGPADHLDVRTLDLVGRIFRSRDDVMVVCGDVVEGGVLLPTPQWDAESVKWLPLAHPPIFFRKSIEGLNPSNAWAKAQDALRASGISSLVRVPLPLVVRIRPPARLPLPPPPAPTRARWPRVSVIIPTKYRTDLLAKCLEGLRTQTDYPDLEIVLVDNGADPTELRALLETEVSFHRIVCVRDVGAFNFSRLINGGVRASDGEVLLLLNDDVIAQEVGWLHRMVDSVLDPSTGAVGARLVYSSGDIQHAGVMLGLGGVCGHLWRNQSAEDAACNPHIVYPGRRMAVTGACLAVRRDAFDKVGGLDEVNYPVTLNDIDFCLRLEGAGFQTIYRGDALLLHDESQSRGSDDEEPRKRERRRGEARTFRKMWGHLLDDDPFASPAFDRSTEVGAVYIPASQIAP